MLVLAVANFIGFDDAFYRQEFAELKVQQNLPKATSLHEQVINFLKGRSSQLPNEFNEREMQHLADVRDIIRFSTLALYAFVIVFALLLIHSLFMLKINNKIMNFVGIILIFGGLLTVALSITLFLFIKYDFSISFESFHLLLFEKGTYAFDPAKEIIVNLYPEQLFIDLGLRISKWIISASAIIISAGLLLLFTSKKNKNL